MTTPQEPWKRWLRALPRGTPSIMVFPERVDPSDIPELCSRLKALTATSRSPLVVCDVAGLTCPDGSALDALARLQLTARRLGATIAVSGPSRELEDLIDFSGLRSVLPDLAPSALEPRRQPEEREEPGGIEEEADPADPSV